MKIVLINPYELGRQPFALAEPTTLLKSAGHDVTCLDLSLQTLDAELLKDAQLIAIYVGMHTATRIAIEAIPRIQSAAPHAAICIYGLYAPINAAIFRELGAKFVLGGEVDQELVNIANDLEGGQSSNHSANGDVLLKKIEFGVPDRSGLPGLERYAHLNMPDGSKKVTGFAEASRGCKHFCRHCPVVPVYQGRFRVVPVEIVLADIRQQVEAGAEHISFGDPDFLNGPTHALKIVRKMHEAFPQLTFDATIKVQHLVKHSDLLPELGAAGCLFVTCAVESIDPQVLQNLDKNHTNEDFEHVVNSLRKAGITIAPTFVPFSPWTTLESYRDLLQRIVELGLVDHVSPVQLTIRLLIPKGSYLLKLENFDQLIEDFNADMLGYPWKHSDARVDDLQREIQSIAEHAETLNETRREIFQKIWQCAFRALDEPAPDLLFVGKQVDSPHMSEPWYCCAEPTSQQLASF
ncbi:MAG: CUAEP/CCAEP-tail radical SAM protein [Gammaproteobacteria bacterium]|nr:CUAEP/CCAEP-tail radical SAM protein [Gammaproteobacteria bacterium]